MISDNKRIDVVEFDAWVQHLIAALSALIGINGYHEIRHTSKYRYDCGLVSLSISQVEGKPDAILIKVSENTVQRAVAAGGFVEPAKLSDDPVEVATSLETRLKPYMPTKQRKM